MAHAVISACTLLECDPRQYHGTRFDCCFSCVSAVSSPLSEYSILKLRAFMKDTALFIFPLNCNLVCMAAALCSMDGQRHSVKHMQHMLCHSITCALGNFLASLCIRHCLPTRGQHSNLSCSLILNLTLLPAGRISVQDSNSMLWWHCTFVTLTGWSNGRVTLQNRLPLP